MISKLGPLIYYISQLGRLRPQVGEDEANNALKPYKSENRNKTSNAMKRTKDNSILEPDERRADVIEVERIIGRDKVLEHRMAHVDAFPERQDVRARPRVGFGVNGLVRSRCGRGADGGWD